MTKTGYTDLTPNLSGAEKVWLCNYCGTELDANGPLAEEFRGRDPVADTEPPPRRGLPGEPSEEAIEAAREASGHIAAELGMDDQLLPRRAILASLRAAYAVDFRPPRVD